MKQGLKVTLMTVAATMLGLHAMAMAPTIKDIPSPIVGSDGGATDATPYVFADAIDLHAASVVADDSTPNAELKWSYEIIGTPKYAINGVAPINSGTENPTLPGAKQINNQVLQSEVNPDGKANTISIRNINLKPFSGTGATPSGQGIIDVQAVTLHASDGSTYSSKTIFFYTDEGGSDRLSVAGPKIDPVISYTFNGSTQGWTATSILGSTTGTAGSTALCLVSTKTADGFGWWQSPFGEIDLVKNAVYRFRATVSRTNGASANTPFWDLVILNQNANNTQGLTLYGADFMFLDNEGGANFAPGATGVANNGTVDFDMWWTPAAAETAQWNADSGIFNAAHATNRKMSLMFRILDVASNGGITAGNDAGTLCLDNLAVSRIDIGQLVANGAASYDNQSLSSANMNAQSVWLGLGQDFAALAPTVAFANGAVTITAKGTQTPIGQDGTNNNNSVDGDLLTLSPGSTVPNPAAPNTIPGNWPVTWEANTLYKVTMKLSAPDAAGEANPWDVMFLGADAPTYEIIMQSYVTGALNRTAMPKQGTPQTYTAFIYSGKVSETTIANGKRLRPRLDLGNNRTLVFHNNTGGIRVHSMTVQKVQLPQ